MTSEYDVDDTIESAPEAGQYRVNVRITNEATNMVWEPGDVLESGEIPIQVLKLYVERKYLEAING